MGLRNLITVTWTQPQLCCDCHRAAKQGWQELKHSEGGPYLEKRCGPCAEVHYGDTLPLLAHDLSKAKRHKVSAKKDDEAITPPMLGLAG